LCGKVLFRIDVSKGGSYVKIAERLFNQINAYIKQTNSKKNQYINKYDKTDKSEN
jgi:hypothetical protein